MSVMEDTGCPKSYCQLLTPAEAGREGKKQVYSSTGYPWFTSMEHIQVPTSHPVLRPSTFNDLLSCDSDSDASFMLKYPMFNNSTSSYLSDCSSSVSPTSSNSSDSFFPDDYNQCSNYMYDDGTSNTHHTQYIICSGETTPDLNDLLSPLAIDCPSARDLVDSVDPFPQEMIDCAVKPEYGVDVQGHFYTFDPQCLREVESNNLPPRQMKPWEPKPYYRENKKGQRSERLWEFIRGLLLNPAHNPSLAEWVDRNNGLFKFNQSKAVAQLWGSRKNNTNMTYEKLSRAMRYYYSRKILLPVIGKKLVYKFGPNSYGW